MDVISILNTVKRKLERLAWSQLDYALTYPDNLLKWSIKKFFNRNLLIVDIGWFVNQISLKFNFP